MSKFICCLYLLQDGTVNIHTIQEGQYLRTLYPSGCEGLATEVTFISISTQGHVAFAANSVVSVYNPEGSLRQVNKGKHSSVNQTY